MAMFLQSLNSNKKAKIGEEKKEEKYGLGEEKQRLVKRLRSNHWRYESKWAGL